MERNCLQQQVLLLYKHSVLNGKTDFCTLNTLNQSNRDYVRVSEMLRIKYSISALFLMHFHTHTLVCTWPPLLPPPFFFFTSSFPSKAISHFCLINRARPGKILLPSSEKPMTCKAGSRDDTPFKDPVIISQEFHISEQVSWRYLTRDVRAIACTTALKTFSGSRRRVVPLSTMALSALYWGGEKKKGEKLHAAVTVMHIPLSPDQNKAAPFWQLPSQSCMSHLSAALSS